MGKVIIYIIQAVFVFLLASSLFLADVYGFGWVKSGWVSSVSDVLGFLSFFGVISLIRDPYCHWQVLNPQGKLIAAKNDTTGLEEQSFGSGPLVGLDNARGFGKSASTNWFSTHGYEEVRFLTIADESVRARFSLLCLRKVFDVTIQLARLPLCLEAAKERAEKAKKVAEQKQQEERQKLIQAFAESEMGIQIAKLYKDLGS